MEINIIEDIQRDLRIMGIHATGRGCRWETDNIHVGHSRDVIMTMLNARRKENGQAEIGRIILKDILIQLECECGNPNRY